MDVPMTNAELFADRATTLPAFGINLTKVRSAVSLVLGEWKSSGVFQEYTDHSFSHVIDMLTAADWIIPNETQSIMTPADWLMLTLASYFHDIGLLVTKTEYDKRSSNAEFRSFMANPILNAEKHDEFVARMDELLPDERERLYYQEFVRSTHGKRVRRWIEGLPLDDAGASSITGSVIIDLLSPLEDEFRRDLAAVCESHTLNHIDTISGLSVSQPYGGPDETCNLQYIAIILRTIDLLQITNRRAPSVLFQILNPSNPTSQLEWQKQTAVRTVRAAEPRDRDGNVTNVGTASVIEVFATVKEPQEFFGLTTYLSYAQKELTSSYNAVLKAKRDTAKAYLFPWRDINTTGVKAIGFMTESFEFALDQHKILELLTGHTLYNNTRVVLRELTQNALDAVRLQAEIEKRSSSSSKGVEIRWNSKERVLLIVDYGTGMTQEVIENHLLTVGSSRYQDRKFKDKYPKFHSISRFGIGVLSAFMVSDDVEITTCSPDQEPARRIALQSVHGKYLIKLLDKVANRSELPMFPHGTMIRLKLRPLADIGDILDVARSWIMFPRCPVHVFVDETPAVKIGYDSPKQAVEDYLSVMRKRNPETQYKVEQFSENGVDLAFGLSRSKLFQDWSFITPARVRKLSEHDDPKIAFATCIEGVSVQNTTPGFEGGGILAITNATGPTAPKTNVARSALEDTAEHRDMLASIYSMYAKHISKEVNSLASSEDYSLSRAVGLAPFIASPFISQNNPASKPDLLSMALSEIPFVLLEEGAERRSISLSNLSKMAKFQTIDSPLYRSIEYFVREAPGDITTEHLLKVLGNRSVSHSALPVVCNMSYGYVEERVRQEFEINRIEASSSARTLSLEWEKREKEPRWFTSSLVYDHILRDDPVFYNLINEARDRARNNNRFETDRSLNVPLKDVTAAGLEDSGSFVASRERYLVPGAPLALYLADVFNAKNENTWKELAAIFCFLESSRASGLSWDIINIELFNRVFASAHMSQLRPFIGDTDDLISAINATSTQTFDSYAWDRRGSISDGSNYW